LPSLSISNGATVLLFVRTERSGVVIGLFMKALVLLLLLPKGTNAAQKQNQQSLC
jgi:hypothetical protein